MNEQTAPVSSKTGKYFAAIGSAITLFIFGFIPFGFLSYIFLREFYEEVSIKILFWMVFLATIAFTIFLIQLAMRSWDDNRNATGIYSVVFGSLAILFAGFIEFYLFRVTFFEEGMMVLLIAVPALFGFPFIGLILGLIGFKSKWGKTGLLLVVVQCVLLATGIGPFGV